MKAIDKLLRHLARTDVTEVAVATGRLPCIKAGGAFKPIDPVAMSTEAIYELLFSAGGSRHVDALGEKPTTWTFRMEGVGAIVVAAVDKAGQVQARFAVTHRDGAPQKTLPSQEAPRKAPSLQMRAAVAPAPAGNLEVDFETVLNAGAPGRPVRNVAPDPGAYAPPLARATPYAATGHELDSYPPPGRGQSPSYPPPGYGEPGYAPPAHDFFDDEARPHPSPLAARAAHAFGDFDDPLPPRRPTEVDDDVALAPEPPAATGALAYTLDFNARGAGDGSGIAHAKAKSRSLEFDGTFASLLSVARSKHASDMHLVSERPLLLRIAGDLLPRGEPLDSRTVEKLLLQEVPPRLRPQLERDGAVDFGLSHAKYGRFRVNVTRQRTGMKGCFRLISEEIPTLEGLGLPEAIAQATHHHQGLIIVTGPTGHGKTTTLTAIVDLINRETSHHVITVEDPVEFVHPRKRALMSQREVGTHTKSFASALKGSLREDPDVIVIGELRDTETVRIALSASETGHLVIGTMNTPSAAKTIDRLIDLFPPGDQQQVRLSLAGGLKMVVSQRLVPNATKNGMVAACEVLPGSMALWNLIRDNKTFQIPSLQQRGKALGIIRLDDTLAELVRSGRTTLPNAMPFAESPDELESKVAGRPAVQLPPGMGQPPAKSSPSGQQRAQQAPKLVPPGTAQDQAKGGLFGGIFGGKKT